MGHVPTSSITLAHSHSSVLLSHTHSELQEEMGRQNREAAGLYARLGGWGSHGTFYHFISQKYSEVRCPYFMDQNTEAKGS